MQRRITRGLTLLTVSVVSVLGCDPIYTVGARQALAPAPPVACVDAVLRASPRRTAVQPLDTREGAGFRLALSDTTAPRGWRDATVRLEGGPDSARAVSLTYLWLGTARSVPLVEQQQMVALAGDVLEEVRAACAPAGPRNIECIARGLGGAGACRAT